MATLQSKRAGRGPSSDRLDVDGEQERVVMVIRLTEGERAILELASASTTGIPVDATASFRANLNFLLELQLVLQSPMGLQITPLGARVLKITRNTLPRR